jgi:hypothetical protein
VNKEETSKSVTFILEAFDSYTSKRIATATGTGKAGNDIVPVLLENAVKAHVNDFDKQLDRFYEQTLTNGREVVLNIKRWYDNRRNKNHFDCGDNDLNVFLI